MSEAKTIDVGEGFRRLAPGERRRAGDEWCTYGDWYLVINTLGSEIRDDALGAVRRAIRVCEDDPTKRYLDEGEKPRIGDEFKAIRVSFGWHRWSEHQTVVPAMVGEGDFRRVMRRSIETPASRSVEVHIETTLPARIRPAKPARVRCGCNEHDVDPAGDLYAQHASYVRGDFGLPEFCPENPNAVLDAPGIGISAPRRALTAFGPDSSGEDVAADAFRTTSGRTLDSIIDELAEVRRG